MYTRKFNDPITVTTNLFKILCSHFIAESKFNSSSVFELNFFESGSCLPLQFLNIKFNDYNFDFSFTS